MIKKIYLLFLITFSFVKIDAQVAIFSENWSTSSFATNNWTYSPSRWSIGTQSTPITGATAPWASFLWSPSILNYSFELVSPVINASSYTSGPVTMNYLLFHDFFSTTTLEQFAIEYKTITSNTWILAKSYNNSGGVNFTVNANDTLFGMAGNNFQVRFRAFGLNSFNIDGWSIDNIAINGFPSPSCSGKPSGGIVLASTNNPCVGATTNFTTSNLPYSGLTYQWYRAPNCNPTATWTPLSGQTSNILTQVVQGTKAYRCLITCIATGDTAWTTSTCVVTQTWSPTGNCWCVPTYSTVSATQFIANVQIGSLHNNTLAAANPAPNYVDYTSQQLATINPMPIPIIYAGIPNILNVTGSSGTNQFSGMWIDYNHNGNFEPTEYASTGVSAGANGVSTINFTPPNTPPNLVSTPTGITRMRIRGGETIQNIPAQACDASASSSGEAEDYLVNILAPKPVDPAVTAITSPVGNCFTNCEPIEVTVQNYGLNNIDLITNPVKVFLKVNNVIIDSQLLTTTNTPSTTLLAAGGNLATVTFPCVDLYAGGTYLINTALTIGNAGGVTNGYVLTDSLLSPNVLVNYRPTAPAPFEICQNQQIGFGQGLTVTGCGNVVYDSIEINFNVNGGMDNVGATLSGTSQTVPGSACSNIFAGDFASAVIPTLSVSNPNFTSAVLTVNNFLNTFEESRFVLYKNQDASIISNIINPSILGYPVPTNIVSTGLMTPSGFNSSSTAYRTFRRNIPNVSSSNFMVSQLFSLPPGSPINVGYWENFNDSPGGSDLTINQGGATEVKLKVYFNYVPSKINWYDNATSTTILDTLVPFNPLGTTGLNATTQLSNTSIPGTYTFFATCDGNDCRVPVDLIIHPSPTIMQDTMSLCEDAPGSNQAVFDLTQLTSSVGLGLPVDYFTDIVTLNQIQSPFLDTTSTVFRYAKVTANGCSSVDSVLLQVNSLPQFAGGGSGMAQLFGNACAPTCVDAASLINFATVPTGSDTLYYEDAACTMLHPNPHSICVADTVWIVLKTNTTPACTDTAVAYIDVVPALNLLVNQTLPFNFSSPGTVPGVTNVLTDGLNQMYYQVSDCRKVASVHDLTNGISLGSTVVNEEISGTQLYYNNQPYVNRVYEVTPTTQDSAEVCLFYLEDDILTYNGNAGSYPQMSSANFTITQTHNGPVGTPGNTFTVIPNSAITSSYDPSTTVWTLCFKVDSFSYFYLHTQNPVNAALPINILSFTGKRVENTSLLKWSTIAEQNNAYFEIERSKDARSFSVISDKIATKAVNGNSNTMLNYDFTDIIPNEGHNYYRLKQTDIDGKTSDAKNVVDVYFGNETMVTLYPNPAHNELNIDINISKATNAKMKIMDATGRVVKQIDMQLRSGGNQTKVSLDELSDGMYMVNITNEKGLNYSQTIRKN